MSSPVGQATAAGFKNSNTEALYNESTEINDGYTLLSADHHASSEADSDSDFEVIENDAGKCNLHGEAHKHVAAIETCRRHLNQNKCGSNCSASHKCDACVDLIAGLETLANCPREWTNDRKTFSENTKKILYCLRRVPEKFQSGLYNLIALVLSGIEDWCTANIALMEQHGFEASVIVWLLPMGVRGLAQALEEGKHWTIFLGEREKIWKEDYIAADEYEQALEDVEGFADLFCVWGAGVLVQREATATATA